MKTITVKKLVIGEGMPKICIPIIGRNKEEIEKDLEIIKSMKPDLAEWRVDCWENEKNDETIWEMLRTISDKLGEIPLLFTFRTKREGGEQEILYEDYVKLLEKAASTGLVDFVDVEVFFRQEETRRLISCIQETGVYVVASNHHFQRTPDGRELQERMRYMNDCGADILKMAVMPIDSLDLCSILEATIRMRQECEKPVVTMAMGSLGVLSRIWGEFTGSCITFAAGREASAPGQIKADEMRKVLKALHEIKERKN